MHFVAGHDTLGHSHSKEDFSSRPLPICAELAANFLYYESIFIHCLAENNTSWTGN